MRGDGMAPAVGEERGRDKASSRSRLPPMLPA